MGDHDLSRTVFDVQGTLHRLGGDEDLLSDMIGIFLDDMPKLLAALQEAVEAQDAESAKKSAHALHGLFLGCGGIRAGRAAQEVEQAASKDLASLPTRAANLKKEIELLVEAICSYRT